MNTSAGPDRRQFAACFEAYWPAVYRYLGRRGAGDRVEDLAAETFLVAWRRWAGVPDDPLPWLLRTARNLLSNDRRYWRRRQQLGVDDSSLAVGPDQTVASVLGADELHGLLREVARLPAGERELLLLTVWDGLSVTQAARVVGCLPVTARSRLSRARRRLARRRDQATEGGTDEALSGGVVSV